LRNAQGLWLTTEVIELIETSESLPGSWQIAEADFPHNGTLAAKLRFFLRYAALAPSNRNAQPWLFYVSDDAIELYADRSRALPLVDPQDRELTIGCGAALFHLRIALRHFGYQAQFRAFPVSYEPDLLARVRLGVRSEPTPEEEMLFHAIPQRHTNRLPFEGTRVPNRLLAALQAAAGKEGAALNIISDSDAKYAVANLVFEADQAQWGDPEFRREMADWLHPSRSSEADGIPGYAFGLESAEWSSAPATKDASDISNAISRRDYMLALASPVLAVLATEADTARDWLSAGQAIARVLLTASAEGVSAAFFNQPLQIAGLRAAVREVTGAKGFPQLMLRLGYGPVVKPTPRRNVSEMVFVPEDGLHALGKRE
jgi:nitroreductase